MCWHRCAFSLGLVRLAIPSPTVSPGESLPMQRFLLPFAVTWLTLLATSAFGAEEHPKGSDADRISSDPTDWSWWRGPNRNGIAAAEQKPPLKWSESENVLWKSPVPGRGHGSPTVVGDQVFLATADHEHEIQSVLCYHRQTGKRLWQTEVHRGGFEKKGNDKSSLASATVACDGQRVFINFLHDGAIYTTALSRDGQKCWQTKVADFVVHQGFGSSPAIYRSLVIVSADNKGGGAIAALDRATGRVVWKQERPKLPNYTSPIILSVAGREQLLLTGCDLVTSLDPLTGKKLWETKGSTTECVTSAVTDGQLIFTSGGYPKNHVSAVRADGSGQTVWENKSRVYVPSLLVRGGYLYAVLDAGIAVCWKCDTGEEVWKGRLGGTFSASPVLVGEHVFATNESGRTFIFKATPAAFDLVAENRFGDLGDEVLATPAICGGRIYLRVATSNKGRRQEMLYCLGKSD
jgi:outer membrane protein assembly factor BamB